MKPGALGFLIWLSAMLVTLVAIIIAERRSRRTDRLLEEVAKKDLPQLGAIATKHLNGTSGIKLRDSWYPDPALPRAKRP